MPDHCQFCQPCGKGEELTSPDTGETITVQALFDRCAESRPPADG